MNFIIPIILAGMTTIPALAYTLIFAGTLTDDTNSVIATDSSTSFPSAIFTRSTGGTITDNALWAPLVLVDTLSSGSSENQSGNFSLTPRRETPAKAEASFSAPKTILDTLKADYSEGLRDQCVYGNGRENTIITDQSGTAIFTCTRCTTIAFSTSHLDNTYSAFRDTSAEAVEVDTRTVRANYSAF